MIAILESIGRIVQGVMFGITLLLIAALPFAVYHDLAAAGL